VRGVGDERVQSTEAGGTLTFRDQMFTYKELDAAAGEYLVGLIAEDLDGNRSLVLKNLHEAESMGADLVCFPELALCGYPPEDLLLKRDFLAGCSRSLQVLAHEVGETAVLVGTIDLCEDLFNAAAVIHCGEVIAMYHKHFLPNYQSCWINLLQNYLFWI